MTGRVRIVGGELGGRLIGCPKEMTRPTADRVREALASAIVSRAEGLDRVHVCDAFAGSGALGLEMLSRGAECVQLYDSSAEAVSVMRESIASLGVQGCVRVDKRDVLKAGIAGPFAPYGILLLDPPYAIPADDVADLVARAASDGLLAPGCIVVYEHESASPDLPQMPGMIRLSDKRYGKASLGLWKLDGNDS
ncbi:MAG: methyltransferase [Eggerthellaceae bacterium]|nr:methyltransferase [Eggerthellaceae bacterium]